MIRRLLLILISASVALPASPQTTGAGYADALTPSIASVANAMHATIRGNLAQAAANMPAEEYAFRPTPDVRTFAQLIGHVINANTFFCSQAAGDSGRLDQPNYEEVSDKARLVAALTESLLLCDRTYDATTDATFDQPVAMPAGLGMGPAKTVRGAVLMFNVAHNNEHYGNIVVYMRLKGHVPPSTANAQPPKR
jgi:uncharacterized damage-inducible protein DinB